MEIKVDEFKRYVQTEYGARTVSEVTPLLGQVDTIKYDEAMDTLERVLDKYRPDTYCGATNSKGRFDKLT